MTANEFRIAATQVYSGAATGVIMDHFKVSHEVVGGWMSGAKPIPKEVASWLRRKQEPINVPLSINAGTVVRMTEQSMEVEQPSLSFHDIAAGKGRKKNRTEGIRDQRGRFENFMEYQGLEAGESGLPNEPKEAAIHYFNSFLPAHIACEWFRQSGYPAYIFNDTAVEDGYVVFTAKEAL
jgi:hypothetical protein